MNDLLSYVNEYALIVIPVLYVIGMMLKGLELIPDKYIPIILLVIGIAVCVGLNGFNANSVIQGILVTGVTVYVNQLLVQSKKDE